MDKASSDPIAAASPGRIPPRTLFSRALSSRIAGGVRDVLAGLRVTAAVWPAAAAILMAVGPAAGPGRAPSRNQVEARVEARAEVPAQVRTQEQTQEQREDKVYFHDPTVDVLVSAGPAPHCTVRFRPALTFGGDLAPRIVLVTTGPSRLSFGIENAERYSSVIIVRHNTRTPLAGVDEAGVDLFRTSDLAAALKSQRLFFVTAHAGAGQNAGRYVSSRYERIDFDMILSKMEAACRFDAESLMSDLRPLLRAERALALSRPDLTLIRWALLKRYDSRNETPAAEPAPRPELSAAERVWLRRYAVDNGLTPSRFLTAETARQLLADGRAIATVAAESFFSLDVCNGTPLPASVAISARKTPDGDWIVKGWWPVRAGACRTLGRFARGRFYVTAVAPGGLAGWNGSELLTPKCVVPAPAFERPDNARLCPRDGRMIGFHALEAAASRYAWTITSDSRHPAARYGPWQPM